VESGGTLLERYFRGVGTDELVAAWLNDTDGKTKPFLFHHDQVNSTTAVTGHNGGTTQSVKYSAFGQVQSSTGASPNRLKYTGREDDNTGLYYYRARYYDPTIGRFISEDPLGFAALDVNFYSYVGNDPVNANDPDGRVPLPLVTGVIGAGASALGSAIGQVINSGGFDTFSFTDVGIAAGVGFVAGVAAPYTAATWVGAALTGGVANVSQYGLTQATHGEQITATGAALSAVTGGVGGAVGGAVARSTGIRFSETSPWLDQNLARSLNQAADISANTAFGNVGRNVLGSTLGSIDLSNVGLSQSAAAGGFLLYPNKPNNNALIVVYGK
jgi:RHS repeat-associated protein